MVQMAGGGAADAGRLLAASPWAASPWAHPHGDGREWSATMNLFIAAAGAGVLSFPFAYRSMGYVLATVCMPPPPACWRSEASVA
jgi:hypothetical protein